MMRILELSLVRHSIHFLPSFQTHGLKNIEREMFYLTTHSTHFIYGYMASDIWLRTILIVRKETRCRHIGYSYRLAARVLLYAPSHRQDNTYHGLCYTSRGALAGTRNSSQEYKPVPQCWGYLKKYTQVHFKPQVFGESGVTKTVVCAILSKFTTAKH